MEKTKMMPDVSVLGGPLHRLGTRLGLVRDANTIRLGLVLGLGAWGVLMLLALVTGFGPRMFSLRSIGIHVRFLVAIPLFFVCETWVAPRIAHFAEYIVRSGMVSKASLPALTDDIRRINRMNDSWLAEALALLVAIGLPMFQTGTFLPGKTGNWAAIVQAAGGKLSLVSGWYLWFCLPLFRFLILRWLWRLGLWWYFLWRVQKLNLRLMPTHSDGVGGLGYLEIVQHNFAPLVLAISAVISAQFAEDISSGTMAFENLYSLVPVHMLLTAALFIGPLLAFTPTLWKCRETGMREYMSFASSYVNAFDRKWIRDEREPNESLLGTPDLQSLADLTNSLNVVRGMRPIVGDHRLIVALAVNTIVPLLPLLLFKFPLEQLAAKLFQMLTGL